MASSEEIPPSKHAQRVLDAIGPAGAQLQIKVADLAVKVGLTLDETRDAIRELQQRDDIVVSRRAYEPPVYWRMPPIDGGPKPTAETVATPVAGDATTYDEKL